MHHKAIVKTAKEHIQVTSAFCRSLKEVLTADDSSAVSVSVLDDVRPTVGHFHATFDEIYLVADGSLTIALHHPDGGVPREVVLGPSELCLIGRSVHHRIIRASEKNRLYVICSPAFRSDDERASKELAG